MRYASAKRRVKSNLFSNNLPDQNDDVLFNPKNPVNPDSKPRRQAPPKTKTTYRKKHTWNPLIFKIHDSEHLISGNIILRPVGEKTRGIASLQGGYIIGLYQIAFGFIKNKAYLVYRYPLPVPVFFRIIPLDNLLKGRIITPW